MTLAANAFRYWHTLRHLKPIQFYRRLWFKLYRPRVDAAAHAPPLRERQGLWRRSIARTPSMLGPMKFRFLNHEHNLPVQGGWNDAALEKLWLYNLHYFDDLNAADADLRRAWHQNLLLRWIAENPPAEGNAWEPYPTSLRIVNWSKWLLAGHVPPHGAMQSLANQARWLNQRIEWHLLGNHLFANAKALVFAGLLFDGIEARRWLKRGLHIIARELPEQILPDGGNFERSPMYHSIFLEDLLDLINIANVWPGLVENAPIAKWHDSAQRMLSWLDSMTHPDGQIALFNDAAFGIAPTTGVLRDYARSLGVVATSVPRNEALDLRHWEDSGYVRLYSGSKAVAFLDVASVGPDYLPGHAHADTLSFELSVFGQRVVVNGGTSRYGLGPERLRERSTAAKSTVEVAGQSSSEVWGGFRVARRAYPFDLQVRRERDRLCVACSHDGYTRCCGSPVHRREWVMEADNLLVKDSLSSRKLSAVARYILHPACLVSALGEHAWQLTLHSGQTIAVKVLGGRPRIEPARYAPEFGKVFMTQCLAVELTADGAQTQWFWN